jgi:imidazolonepropionase-like amidohydrolase
MRATSTIVRQALAAATLAAGARAQEVRATGPYDIPLVIEHVTVVDVERGVLLRDRNVEVTGRRITAVDSGRVRRAAARRVDGSGKFVIPGLWDMHVHVLPDDRRPHALERWFPALLATGVTGVRDMGGHPDTLRAVRARMNRDTLLAPRLLAPGPILDGPPGRAPSSWIIRTPADGRRAVDVLARGGADFVKASALLSRESYLAIADQAKARGIALAAHPPDAMSALEAAAAGARSLEHVDALVVACTVADSLRRSFDEAACRRAMRELARLGTWITPTLVDVASAATLAIAERVVAIAHAEGVPILAGTDGGARFRVPEYSLHHELARLVHAGLPPAAALRAATLEPARWLSAADTMGTVAPGKVADLVLLDADPLADIGNTTRVHAVVANGRWLDRASIHALLAR